MDTAYVKGKPTPKIALGSVPPFYVPEILGHMKAFPLQIAGSKGSSGMLEFS